MEKLRKFKESYIENIARGSISVKKVGLVSKLFFSWITPFVKIGKSLPIEFEMMPHLSQEFTHQIYTKKVREEFQNQVKTFDPKKKNTFIIWLVFGCFKWDILCAIFLSFLVQLFGYSTTFCIQNILEIKNKYSEELQIRVFIGLVVSMLFFKLCNVICSQYTMYFMVF